MKRQAFPILLYILLIIGLIATCDSTTAAHLVAVIEAEAENQAQSEPPVAAASAQQPELPTGLRKLGELGDSNSIQPDQPVVCVSWYEAVAYTRWLTRETSLDVHLPSAAACRNGLLWGTPQPGAFFQAIVHRLLESSV